MRDTIHILVAASLALIALIASIASIASIAVGVSAACRARGNCTGMPERRLRISRNQDHQAAR